MKMTPERVIENLRRIRELKGLTQKEMAKRLSVTNANYSKLENSQSNPNLRTLAKVCEAMGIELIDLMRDPNVRNQALEDKLLLLSQLPDDERSAIKKMIEMALERNNLERQHTNTSIAKSRKDELEGISERKDEKDREH